MEYLSKIYLVTEKLNKLEAAQVEAAELALGTRFPLRYKEFLTNLGSGTFCDLVYVLPPHRITEEAAAHQRIFSEHGDFWEEKPPELTDRKFSELIVFSHTLDGDMLAFHPDNPYLIYVVPRHELMVYAAGRNFYQALETLVLNYGKPNVDDFRWFDSHVDQCRFEMIAGEAKASREELITFMDRLNLRAIDKSDEDSSMFFVREFGGNVYLGSPFAAKQTFAVTFDCDSPTPEKLKNYFAAKGFRTVGEGRRK